MKKMVSIIYLIVMVIGVTSTAYCNGSYTVKYKSYTPGNIAFLSYLQWDVSVKVDGKSISLLSETKVENLNCLIVIKGKNSKSNLIYKGTISENLNTGNNNLAIAVNKVNTDPNIWSPGDNVLNWRIHIGVVNLSTPTPTPTPTPTLALKTQITTQETNSPKKIDEPKDPLDPKKIDEPNKINEPKYPGYPKEIDESKEIEKPLAGKELPKTGEKFPLIIYLTGGILIILGIKIKTS